MIAGYNRFHSAVAGKPPFLTLCKRGVDAMVRLLPKTLNAMSAKAAITKTIHGLLWLRLFAKVWSFSKLKQGNTPTAL
jgi:hypothetical protein